MITILNKVCSTCEQELSLGEFQKDLSRKDGLNKQCRKCSAIRAAKYRQSTSGSQVQRKYYRKNRDKILTYTKAYQKARPLATRNRALLRRYSLTIEQHQQIYSSQNCCCALCGNPTPYDKIHTDHEHETGKVRGLLCCRCNMGLGFWEDSIEGLQRAIEYLRKNE
ncbi:hypothetical protein LCGC14_0946770 [marine sediment metagenome]|uniref:Recombination endonuclease VII n=1 Tax=marine sediment metagenome TaxID=412755 RepID=A0A0F9P4L9_9ZZZZ